MNIHEYTVYHCQYNIAIVMQNLRLCKTRAHVQIMLNEFK